MPDTRLQTILHISDLHFGHGGQNAQIPNDIGWIKWLEGLLGHHWAALEQLERFASRLKQRDPAAVLIVSGDLTVNGAQQQFDLAAAFLGQGSAGLGLGLELSFPHWRDSTVPGNHDHWPGFDSIVGPPTQAFQNVFPGPYPIIPPPVQLGQGVTLQYILLDTDEEVGSFSRDRTLARGRFRQQIVALDRELPSKRAGEIRVLVLHHAVLDLEAGIPAHQAPFPRKSPSSPSKRFEVEPMSLNLLEQAIVRHRIEVVMSGHLHVSRLTELTAVSALGRQQIFDARCGTSTQIDEYPKAFRKMLQPGRDALPLNSLIVHELWRRGERLCWEAQVHQRSNALGFTPFGPRRSFDLA